HDAQAHTFGDHFCKAHVHEVGQLTYGNEFRYLQLVVLCVLVGHLFCQLIAFVAALFGFCAFAAATAAQLGHGFLDLVLYLVLINFFVLLAFVAAKPVAACSASTGSASTGPAVGRCMGAAGALSGRAVASTLSAVATLPVIAGAVAAGG